MTPEERIEQLAAQHGGVATFPCVVRPADTAETPSRPSKPNGLDVRLPEAWRQIADTWDNRERIGRLQNLETYLAAGVIVRYLGKDWHREKPDSSNGWVDIIHRDGHGFHFRRDWHDHGRFQSSPLETYRRNEPASITTSASRPLGAIARDIENRLINNGLRDAYEQQQAADHERREEIRARFDAISSVSSAFGGRIVHRRRWQANDYPEADIPYGWARIGYGFNGRAIELTFTTDIETAKKLAVAMATERIK